MKSGVLHGVQGAEYHGAVQSGAVPSRVILVSCIQDRIVSYWKKHGIFKLLLLGEEQPDFG